MKKTHFIKTILLLLAFLLGITTNAQTVNRRETKDFDEAGFLICKGCGNKLYKNKTTSETIDKTKVLYHAIYEPCDICGKVFHHRYNAFKTINEVTEDPSTVGKDKRYPTRSLPHRIENCCEQITSPDGSYTNYRFTNRCEKRETVYVYIQYKNLQHKMYLIEYGNTVEFKIANHQVNVIRISHNNDIKASGDIPIAN